MLRLSSIALLVLCLLSALASLFLAQPINQIFSGFHGYQSHVSLQLSGISEKSDTPSLIMPSLTHCVATCPNNLGQIQLVVKNYKGEIDLFIMAIERDDRMSAYLARVADLTHLHPRLIDHRQNTTWKLLAKYEQIQSNTDTQSSHAGHLYLYDPSSSTLLTYVTPNSRQIIDDLKQLSKGAKHG